MATTTTAVRSTSNVSAMARPLQPPLSSADSAPSSTSPSAASKPIPTAAHNIKPLNNASNTNGILSRTRPRPRPSQVKTHDKAQTNGEQVNQRPKEPYVKDASYILRKFRGKSPSLILHLHQTYFRFDQQDGTFSYNSEMRIIIEHLKARTVPHDLIEELLQANVTFYDGCLIVEVHDHRTAATGNMETASSSGDLRGSKLFTLHDNSNRFITPSPYAPYPNDREPVSRPSSSKENVNAVSESMPAPEKPAKKSNKPRVFTVVLHPTDLVRHREVSLLTRTPMIDQKGSSRRQASVSGRERPTPLSAIPPTPTSASAPTPFVIKGVKRQRMCLEEGDIHTFEAEVFRTEYPNLLLEPIKDFQESQAMMDLLRDPLHDHKPSKKQSRKRTTAELAADEAQAAEEERIALIMDDRLGPSLASGDSKAPDFQPDFSRFKKFEDIKRNHEQEAHRKKEEEARLVHDKNARSEEEKRRQAQEAAARQEQQLRQHRALEAQKATAQRNAMQQQQQQQAQHQSPMHNAMMQQMMQQQQQASQGPHMSPVAGTQAPVNSSPLVGNVFSNSMQGAAMAPTSSTQGPGSPPRPGSAMPAPQGMAPPMGRQVSQQASQPDLSHNSTPQISHATPQMRNMTPQPPQGHMPNGVQHTPVMGPQQMRTPQMNVQQQMHQLQQVGQHLSAQLMHAQQAGNAQQVARIQHAMQHAQQKAEFVRHHTQLRQQQQQQAQVAQSPVQMQMQGSPQANHFGAQMSPHVNGMPVNSAQLQMQPNMQQQQQQGNQQHIAQRMHEYRRSLAQAAQSKITNPQASNQSSPHSPQSSSQQQFPSHVSSAGSPNGIQMTPAMNRNPTQFPNQPGQMQSPHPQQPMNHMGQGGQQQQPRLQNPQAAQQINQFRQAFVQKLARENGGQLPADHEQRWALCWRQRQAHAQMAQRNAQQAAGQGNGGMMMPGQGLQTMQQAGMRPPGQAQPMNMYEQQQRQAQMMKIQQQRQIAMQQQQQNQQQGQQGMMNGIGQNMMGGVNGAMSNGMGRPG